MVRRAVAVPREQGYKWYEWFLGQFGYVGLKRYGGHKWYLGQFGYVGYIGLKWYLGQYGYKRNVGQ